MLQGFLARSSWRLLETLNPNQRTTKMLRTRLQQMSSVHLPMCSTASYFGVRTGLIFLRTLSSLDASRISRAHEGSGAFKARKNSTTQKLPMSALGQKQTSRNTVGRSALCQKETHAPQNFISWLKSNLKAIEQCFCHAEIRSREPLLKLREHGAQKLRSFFGMADLCEPVR
jgi:hypothetical protein